MLGVLAAVTAALGFLLNGLQAHTNTWFSPQSLSLLALTLLSLYIIGAGSWPRRP